MKKIPTLFERVFDGHKIVGITSNVMPGLEDVLGNDSCVATVKYDGSCCAIIDMEFYKRYDAKKGKKVPEGAIPCCEPDPVTGHHPHWVKVDANSPADKWFIKALANYSDKCTPTNGTYEAVGPHFQGNPYGLEEDTLIFHGMNVAVVEKTFDGIRKYLTDNEIEGLVFWKDSEPVCKIKRSDFGLEWPVRKEVVNNG